MSPGLKTRGVSKSTPRIKNAQHCGYFPVTWFPEANTISLLCIDHKCFSLPLWKLFNQNGLTYSMERGREKDLSYKNWVQLPVILDDGCVHSIYARQRGASTHWDFYQKALWIVFGGSSGTAPSTNLISSLIKWSVTTSSKALCISRCTRLGGFIADRLLRVPA